MAAPNFAEALARGSFVTLDGVFVGWLAVDLLGGGLHALFLVTSLGAALMGVWMIAVVARTRWRV